MQYAAVRQEVGAPLRTVTVKDAIGDLPSITNGASQEEMAFAGEQDIIPAFWFILCLRSDGFLPETTNTGRPNGC